MAFQSKRTPIKSLSMLNDLQLKVEKEQELAMVWIMASALLIVWKLRSNKSRVQLYKVRAQMEANINLLRETRHSNTAIILDQLVDRYF